MIALLRFGALMVNVAVIAGAAWLCGAPWWGGMVAVAIAAAFSFWACGRAPAVGPANEHAVALAQELCGRMAIPPPQYVRSMRGRSAGVVRARGGYGLLVGVDLPPHLHEAVIAHELAHVVQGDVAWEPWTDGPARLVVQMCTNVPLLWTLGVPFLVFGVPLARVTELGADRIAASLVPGYPLAIKELTSDSRIPWPRLYPTLEQRLAVSARGSLSKG